MDLDSMLYEDMAWLVRCGKLPLAKFLEYANKIELTQENWSLFWKRLDR